MAENGNEVSTESSYRFTATSDRILTAYFVPENVAETEYIITFDANGGKTDTASAKTVNKKLPKLPAATRSGYTSNGWYTKASGGSKVTTDTEFNSDTAVYAHWTKKEGSRTKEEFRNSSAENISGNKEIGIDKTESIDDGNELDDVPETGDASSLYFWFFIVFLSGLGTLYFRSKG